MSSSHDLLIVAVSRYADSCPKTLHPDCPFATAGVGGRTCNVECRGVVTNLIRPQGAKGETAVFDAGQIVMLDQATSMEPTSQWSTTSLVSILRKVIRSRPTEVDGRDTLRRTVDATDVAAYLEQRGVDVRRLVVEAFSNEFALAMDATLVFSQKSTDEECPVIAAWQELRSTVVAPSNSREDFVLSEAFQAKVRAWLAGASLDEIFHWTAPRLKSWAKLSEAGRFEVTDSEFLWFADRFVSTYLSDWSRQSLVLEYRYLVDGRRPSNIPADLLLERQITKQKVADELADRVVNGHPEDMFALQILTDRALEAIKEGHRDVAAAIFASARTLSPDDARLANNHAFCLIPDQPAEAARMLQELGRHAQNLLLECNSAACSYLLGDHQDVLEHCEAGLNLFNNSGDETAWLWQIPLGDQPVVSSRPQGVYICELGVRAAEALGEEDIVIRWSELLREISTDG